MRFHSVDAYTHMQMCDACACMHARMYHACTYTFIRTYTTEHLLLAALSHSASPARAVRLLRDATADFGAAKLFKSRVNAFKSLSTMAEEGASLSTMAEEGAHGRGSSAAKRLLTNALRGKSKQHFQKYVKGCVCARSCVCVGVVKCIVCAGGCVCGVWVGGRVAWTNGLHAAGCKTAAINMGCC